MGRIVVSQFMSLDGVVEDPGGVEGFERGGWAFAFDRGREGDRFKLDEALAGEALLMGRLTYEVFAASWPSRSGPMADKLNTMPKYVVSSTMGEPPWDNSRVIRGEVAQAVRALKGEHHGDILVHGSVQLVELLAREGLIDEYRLMVFPTVLGTGTRLFGAASPQLRMRITSSAAAGDTLILTLEPSA